MEEPEIVNSSQVLIEVRAASLDPVDLKVSLISLLTFQMLNVLKNTFCFVTKNMDCSAQVSQGYGRGLRELVSLSASVII